MPAKKLENLLNPSKNGDLATVIQRARAMGELTSMLSAALPASDRDAIVAANLRDDGELVVICATSAWANRLRYESDTLLDAAKKAGVVAKTVRVRVAQG